MKIKGYLQGPSKGGQKLYVHYYAHPSDNPWGVVTFCPILETRKWRLEKVSDLPTEGTKAALTLIQGLCCEHAALVTPSETLTELNGPTTCVLIFECN